MSFDGLMMHFMNEELKRFIVGGRISKIHQPNAFELVLTIRANRQNFKLLFHINADSARYHLTQNEFSNPETPTNFCMVLRKHLEGAVLTGIQQIQMDRISTFVFSHQNELGDKNIYHLSVEIMGRHSQISLISPISNKIIECIKHIPASKNSYRIVLPNATYTLPPVQQKLHFFQTTTEQLQQLITNGLSIDTMQAVFQGFSRSTVQYLKAYQEAFDLTVLAVLQQLQKTTVTPYTDGNIFLPFHFTEAAQFETLSALLDHFYFEKSKSLRQKQASQWMTQRVQGLLSKNYQKIEHLTNDLAQAENAENLRVKGELITANAHRISRGQQFVTVENYYENNAPITIALKIEKNAIQNAKDYFKKYQKLKQSLSHLKQQLQATQDEITYLESVLVNIQHASIESLEAIKEELMSGGYIKSVNKTRKKQQKPLPPMTYVATDGTIILVGRNNLQNDQLTLKKSPKQFIWLHAKDIPGSHVIIQHNQPSEATLIEAAKIAAFHSKYQLSANVPVDYVRIQNIRKPNGSKPGFVIFEGQQTLYVTANEEEILLLKQKEE